eukprot:jgi/Tetstr1/464382/TSEL_009175.t1
MCIYFTQKSRKKSSSSPVASSPSTAASTSPPPDTFIGGSRNPDVGLSHDLNLARQDNNRKPYNNGVSSAPNRMKSGARSAPLLLLLGLVSMKQHGELLLGRRRLLGTCVNVDVAAIVGVAAKVSTNDGVGRLSSELMALCEVTFR